MSQHVCDVQQPVTPSVCFLGLITGEAEESQMESICVESRVREKQEEEEKRDVMRSRSSSTSSEDYIIILPDCFDTTRPLGESMYRYEPWLWSVWENPRLWDSNQCFHFFFVLGPAAALLCPSPETSKPRPTQTQIPPQLSVGTVPQERGRRTRWMKRLQEWSCQEPAVPTICCVHPRRWTMSR